MAAPKKPRGLGKGLDALFGDAEVTLSVKKEKEAEAAAPRVEESGVKLTEDKPTENGISYVNINDIKPNSNQPRKTFDEEKLRELASSIEEHGLIQDVYKRQQDAKPDSPRREWERRPLCFP